MPAKAVYVAAAALFAAVGINAQAAPNWAYIPTSCESQCSQTIESSYLCSQQYPNDSLNTYACFCSSYPSDASTCASCLNSNNAAALGQLLTSTQTACPQAQKSCFFACSFDTCASSDVACQCSASYLENIYNCGSCNTANGNTGATQLKDWQALNSSCGAQNYTGVTQSFTTIPQASASNKNNYVAPSLTATGGGLAATGAQSQLGAVSSGASGASTGNTAPTTIAGAGSQSASVATSASAVASSSASKASSAAAGSGSASGSSSAAAATSSKPNAGVSLVAPAGGVLAFIGGLVALL